MLNKFTKSGNVYCLARENEVIILAAIHLHVTACHRCARLPGLSPHFRSQAKYLASDVQKKICAFGILPHHRNKRAINYRYYRYRRTLRKCKLRFSAKFKGAQYFPLFMAIISSISACKLTLRALGGPVLGVVERESELERDIELDRVPELERLREVQPKWNP